MSSISDIIEHYLKRILNESDTGVIEIKRSELADVFQCVPSQINYVISTRFTLERGYVVESRRGGGGYIRIRKVQLQSCHTHFEELMAQIGPAISQLVAEHLLGRMVEEGWMTSREAILMRQIVARETLQLPLPLRDQIRARLMRVCITTLFTCKGE